MHRYSFFYFVHWKCTRVQSFDFSRKTKLNSIYKIFIFVLLYFWSLFTMNVRAFFSPFILCVFFFVMDKIFYRRIHIQCCRIPNVTQLYTFFLLLAWPLCFHCICLCIPNFWWLKWRIKGRQWEKKSTQISSGIEKEREEGKKHQQQKRFILFISSFLIPTIIVACLHSISWQCQFFLSFKLL